MSSEKHQPFISCIVPVLNSEHTIRLFTVKLIEFFDSTDLSYEIILTDDGSKDKSHEEIIKLSVDFPEKVQYVFLQSNKGQHFATLAGLHFARGKYIVTIDDDYQHNPNDITKLFNLTKQFPNAVCYGIPLHKTGISVVRKFFTQFIYFVNHVLRNKREKVSSFRCMTADMAKYIISKAKQNVNIEQIIFRNKITCKSIDVEHFPSIRGQSRYSLFHLFRFVIVSLLCYTYIIHALVATIALVVLFYILFCKPAGNILYIAELFIVMFLLYLIFLKKRFNGTPDIYKFVTKHSFYVH